MMRIRTLCGDDTSLTQRVVEELEVRLLEECLSRSFWVAGVGDDDVERVLVI